MAPIGAGGLDLAVLPIGDLFTMGPDDALEAVKLLKPKQVVPSHYNTWPPIAQDPNEWAERVRAETKTTPIVVAAGPVASRSDVRRASGLPWPLRRRRQMLVACDIICCGRCSLAVDHAFGCTPRPRSAGSSPAARSSPSPSRRRRSPSVAYSGKKTATEIDLSMDLTWRVSAAENGQFRLEQSLDRLSVTARFADGRPRAIRHGPAG